MIPGDMPPELLADGPVPAERWHRFPPGLAFVRVDGAKQVKNRLHLDVRAAPGLQGEERMAALEAECARLVALGAVRVQRHEPGPPMSAGHIVMQDPEGNEFCLV